LSWNRRDYAETLPTNPDSHHKCPLLCPDFIRADKVQRAIDRLRGLAGECEKLERELRATDPPGTTHATLQAGVMLRRAAEIVEEECK
jgi:hypothetical protein